MGTNGKAQWLMIYWMLAVVGCTAISHDVSQNSSNRQSRFSLPHMIQDLAGPWEYVDKTGIYTIIFDAEGKGTYEWEKGRFETQSLRNGVWRGIWVQEGNDREGGFTLTFSEGSPVAQGKWWYTRIGKDREPLQAGGQFSMRRPSVFQLAQ